MFENHKIYQSLLTNKARRAVSAVKPAGSGPEVLVQVLDGLHAGMDTTIDRRTFTIGGGDGCDMVLLDDGIAELHASVSFDSTVLGDVMRVRTDRQDVHFNDEALPPQTDSPFVSLPTELVLGSTTLRFTSAGQQAKAVKRGPLDRVIRMGVAALLIVSGLLVLEIANQTSIGKSWHIAVTDEAAEVAETAADPADAVTELRQRIASAGLARFITVAQPSPNTVLVEGSLPPAKLDLWQQTHRWFDGQPHGLVLTSRIKSAPALSDFPAIALVRLSEPATLVFMDGTRASVGNNVGNNWTITEITSAGLALERNGEVLNVAF